MPTNAHLVKATVFPVVMYGHESWTRKKAECRRIDAFELWCWRRHLIVPWTARRSNQSILKEINHEYSLAGLMLKLKSNTLAISCKELTHLKRPWCWERLKAGGEGDNRGWDSWMTSLTWWTWVWVSSGSWGWTGKPGVLQSMGSQRVGHDWATEMNWGFIRKDFYITVFFLHKEYVNRSDLHMLINSGNTICENYRNEWQGTEMPGKGNYREQKRSSDALMTGNIRNSKWI